MRKRGMRSIRATIHWTTSLLSILVLVFAVVFYLQTTATQLRTHHIRNANQMAKILSSRLDDIVRQLNALQIKILASETTRDYVFSDFSSTADGAIYMKQRQFEQEVFTISGYDFPFSHMSILREDGVLLHFGKQYSISTLAARSPQLDEYLLQIKQRRGALFLSGLDDPRLYQAEREPTLAISRSFSRYPLNEHRAVMELQVSHDMLHQTIHSALLSYDTLSDEVIVYDASQQRIYPATLQTDTLLHYLDTPSDKKAPRPDTGEYEIVSRYLSPYTGWTVALITPYAALSAGIQQYIAPAIGVCALAIVIAMALAYWLARGITTPLASIQNTLLSVNLDSLNSIKEGKFFTHYNELDLLQDAVEEMSNKMESSLHDYVQLRALSIQSKLLALQSQMNPHFMYNTLSIMAILAEENGDAPVSRMCMQLSSMLRYSTMERDMATLAQEAEHTRQYIELIQVRFGEKVQIHLHIAPELQHIAIPPIIMQPLVENSVKYGRTGQGVLRVHVTAEAIQRRWRITVRDTGAGFSQEALAALQQQIAHLKTGDWAIHTKTIGVGLANIHQRLDLFYEGDFDFSIKNSAQGATIMVGGPLSKNGGAASC